MTTWWYAEHLDSADIDKRDVRSQVEIQSDANLQGSPNGDGTHSIVLDLDCPHEYRPSTTPGHAHLIIPAKLTTEQYRDLLCALKKVGVITGGYMEHARRRDWTTFVRAPGVVKPEGAAKS